METVMTDSLIYKPATELSRMLADGSITSIELTKAFIERTKEVEPKVNAFLSFDELETLKQAEASDKRRKEGSLLSPLDGIPVGIKDVIAQKGQPLTCASRILENFVSPYDAHVSEKLKSAGAVLWGRLNMDEFAMGSSTENSGFKCTANPWNQGCTPGGSSGGSAAAVAALEAPLALGSDTGGSVRQPAAFCGIVGLKPTYGLISRYGLVAFASSLDQIGPMGRTVEDVALLLQAIAGKDERDSTSYPAHIPNYLEGIAESKGPWSLGVPKEYFGEGLNDEVRRAVESAIRYYEAQGCTIKEVSIPSIKYAIATYYIIATAEASSNLARYDGIRYTHRSKEATNAIDIYAKSRAEGFGKEVIRRIILGTYVLSSGYYDAYYLKAQKVRSVIRQDFMNAFNHVNALITPTCPTPAFKIGEKINDPLAMYLNDIYTVSINLAGLPGISIPCGMSEQGLPIGLQLIGKPYEEASLLAIGHMFEQGHDFYKNFPSL